MIGDSFYNFTKLRTCRWVHWTTGVGICGWWWCGHPLLVQFLFGAHVRYVVASHSDTSRQRCGNIYISVLKHGNYITLSSEEVVGNGGMGQVVRNGFRKKSFHIHCVRINKSIFYPKNLRPKNASGNKKILNI